MLVSSRPRPGTRVHATGMRASSRQDTTMEETSALMPQWGLSESPVHMLWYGTKNTASLKYIISHYVKLHYNILYYVILYYTAILYDVICIILCYHITS